MNKYRFVLLPFLIFLFSCSENSGSDILDKDTMVAILIRTHIAEAKTSNANMIGDTVKIYYKSLEDTIFSHYHTDKKSFENSYKYYMENPAEIEKIYTQVVDSLSLREAIGKID